MEKLEGTEGRIDRKLNKNGSLSKMERKLEHLHSSQIREAKRMKEMSNIRMVSPQIHHCTVPIFQELRLTSYSPTTT